MGHLKNSPHPPKSYEINDNIRIMMMRTMMIIVMMIIMMIIMRMRMKII